MTHENLVRYWAKQAVLLCKDIEDDELAEYCDPVEKALEGLDRDRRILVLGGADSAKSELLAQVARVPTVAHSRMQGHYVCWRYFCRDGDATNSRFIPKESLAGLELVDTADCHGEEVQKTCLMLMQGADVLLCVFCARDVMESPVWRILAQVPEPMLEKCILAVTWVERADARQALVLRQTLRDGCRQTVGRELTYCLLPNMAENSVEPLREQVQELLNGPGGVLGSLNFTVRRALELVEKQSRVLRTRESISRTDSGFLAGIDREIDNFHARQMIGLDEHCRNLSAAMQGVIPELLQEIRSNFGYMLSPVTLARLEQMGARMDRSFQHQVAWTVRQRQEESDALFINSCAGHWRSVRPRMKRSLACEIGDFPQEQLTGQLVPLRERLCRDICEPFDTEGLRRRLSRLFIAQAGWMHACIRVFLLLLCLGGVLGSLGQDAAGVICIGLAVLTWFAGSISHNVARKRLNVEIGQLSTRLCRALDGRLHGVLECYIISRLAAYRELYAAPREKVARRDAMLRPLKQARDRIHIQLSALLPRL